MAPPSRKRPTVVLALIPFVAAGVMLAVSQTEIARQWENATLDWRFRTRADSDGPPDPRIALVGIGENSLKTLGRWEEWTRDFHGKMAEALTSRPPEVLAFDFFFSEKSRDPANDLAFADGLAFHPGAITGMAIETGAGEDLDDEFGDEGVDRGEPPYLGKTKPLQRILGDRSKILGGDRAAVPIPVIAESAWTGVVNSPSSPVDGMRRELPLVGRVGDSVYPSMVLQILMQLEDADADDVQVVLGEAIRLPRTGGGEWRIPIDSRGFLPLNYRDTERFEIQDYASILTQLLRSDDGAAWPDGVPPLEGQLVIVGQSATALPDLGPTPYSANDPLFRIQATALNSILRTDYLREAPFFWVLLGWLAVAWPTLFLLKNAHVALAIGVPLLVAAIYVAATFRLFASSSIVLPLVLPVLGFAFIHATVIGERLVAEARAKRHIHWVFGSYVAQAIVDRIVATGEMPKLGGEKVDITVLFSDIQGFSTFSEQLPPERLVELMVEYLSEMTDLVLDLDGTLDKYIGDAIDAMFGAPVPYPDHAYHAVSCALKMQEKQEELCARWRSQGDLPDLVHNMRTRIGLNSGDAVVGNMGSRRRFNYTMMGDNVNLGARCESAAKSYGVYTMTTEQTRQAATATRDDVIYRYLDRIVVVGRTVPVKVYEIVGFRGTIPDGVLAGLERYAEAIDHYLARRWEEALKLFRKAAASERFQPGRDSGIVTNPSLVMVDRCLAMQSNPPPEDWNGVYEMKTK
ncbi:MAG: adenylate/guanylate cyclase domain-containing protein [Verrucomicrobiales bacterium]